MVEKYAVELSNLQDHVVIDYGKKLLTALNNSDDVIASSAQLLLISSSNQPPTSLTTLNELKIDHEKGSHDTLPKRQAIDVATMTIESKYPLVFYNSLAIQRQQLVFVLIDDPNVKVS